MLCTRKIQLLVAARSAVNRPHMFACWAVEEHSLAFVSRAQLHGVEAQPSVAAADALLVHL